MVMTQYPTVQHSARGPGSPWVWGHWYSPQEHGYSGHAYHLPYAGTATYGRYPALPTEQQGPSRNFDKVYHYNSGPPGTWSPLCAARSGYGFSPINMHKPRRPMPPQHARPIPLAASNSPHRDDRSPNPIGPARPLPRSPRCYYPSTSWTTRVRPVTYRGPPPTPRMHRTALPTVLEQEEVQDPTGNPSYTPSAVKSTPTQNATPRPARAVSRLSKPSGNVRRPDTKEPGPRGRQKTVRFANEVRVRLLD